MEEIELRKLQSSDFFTVSKIAAKLDLDIKAILKNINALKIEKLDENATAEQIKAYKTKYEDNSADVTDVLVKKIFYKLYLAEEEITSLISALSGKTVKEIKTLEINIFMKILTNLIKDSGLISFFK